MFGHKNRGFEFAGRGSFSRFVGAGRSGAQGKKKRSSELGCKKGFGLGSQRPGEDPGLVLQVAGIEDITGVGFDKAGECSILLELVAQMRSCTWSVIGGDPGDWACRYKFDQVGSF